MYVQGNRKKWAQNVQFRSKLKLIWEKPSFFMSIKAILFVFVFGIPADLWCVGCFSLSLYFLQNRLMEPKSRHTIINYGAAYTNCKFSQKNITKIRSGIQRFPGGIPRIHISTQFQFLSFYFMFRAHFLNPSLVATSILIYAMMKKCKKCED